MAVFDPITGFIVNLHADERIVVGTNADGNHGGGLAKQAKEQFGLEDGVANGLSGQCFAIDTMSGKSQIMEGFIDLVKTARKHPHKVFLLTPIGQGIAGYSRYDIEQLWDLVPTYLDGRSNRTDDSVRNIPKNIVKVGW